MVEESLFSILMNGIFIKNFLLIQFLGLCSFVGVTKDTKSAAGMSGAVIFVMTMAAIASYTIFTDIVVPFDLQFLLRLPHLLGVQANLP